MANNNWILLKKVLDAKTPRVLVYGPPATGKSMTPYVWAQNNEWAFKSVTLTEETPMTELRGHFVLKGNEFVWHDGLIASAWRESHKPTNKGILVVLNEINHAGGDVMSFLHNALDDPQMAQVHLPNNESLTPKQGKIIYVATMNGTPDELPEPVRDRFPVQFHMPDPNPEALKTINAQFHHLVSTTIGTDRQVTIRMIQAYEHLRNTLSLEDAATAIFGDAAPGLLTSLRIATTK